MQSVSANFAQRVQRDALRFAEADLNGDNKLTWDEFLAMQPLCIREMHSEQTIRGWFTAADFDGNGSVSINEFFRWSIQRQSLTGIEALQTVFSKYDANGTGCIDMEE